MDEVGEAMLRIRAARASPPGHATSSDRRKTFSSALAQFDELMALANVATPATRPLPLFYALSQAGRAIAAAHTPTGHAWRMRGHGLTVPTLEVAVPEIPIEPAPRTNSRSIDSFAGLVAATTGETLTEKVKLKQVWASIPEICGLLPFDYVEEPRPMLLIPDPVDVAKPEGTLWGRFRGTLVWSDGDDDAVMGQLARHFTEAARELRPIPADDHPHTVIDTEQGWGLRVEAEADAPNPMGHIRTLYRIAPGPLTFTKRWLRPTLGGADLSPVAAWWVLLYALSNVARYEPGRWSKALDLDESPIAAPLQAALDVALETVPLLVRNGLNGRPDTFLTSV